LEDEVKHKSLKWSLTVAALAAILVLGACKKKVAPPPPPPPPPAAAPTASLSANPATIDPGQSTTLTWRTENATDVTLEGVGKVDASGSQQVTPATSTTYRLVARGPGGTQDATARVTVNQAAVTPPPVTRNETLEELFVRNVKDAFFDYDSYTIRADAQQALQSSAAFLKEHPELRVTIEGHCDERGSTEYNLALGDNRARAAKDALVQLGVSADRLNPISFGKEKPFCSESNEQCWQQNRRAHFVNGAGR
jgi:peptidoglycan-associated lipoprotein